MLYTEISDLKELQPIANSTAVAKNETVEDIEYERDYFKNEAIKLDRLYSNHTMTVK